METFKIPVFSKNFSNKVEKIVKAGLLCYENSKQIIKEAEDILQKEIGFESYISQKESCSIKSFSESFGQSGRIDAEYYQKKYDNLFKVLWQFSCKKLSDIVTIRKSIEPGSDCYFDEGIPFIRVSDISKYGISEPTIKVPYNIIDNVQSLFLKKDTILLTKDGSIGIAYKVEEDKPYITSGALLHLNILNTDEVNPDYLTLVLNSKIVQMQAERDAGGSIIKHWKPSEIEDVIIPILSKDVQKEIANKVKKSFECRKQSQSVLEYAIKLVETAIEQGEDVALKMCGNCCDHNYKDE